jgi:hypothetical protein
MDGPRGLTLVPCPACGVPAEVTGRFSLASTGGPVEHLCLRCVDGHHFRAPADLLPAECRRQLRAQDPQWAAARGTGRLIA